MKNCHAFTFHLCICLALLSGVCLAQTETKIRPDDPGYLNFFGFAVSISDDYAVIGARGDDDHGVLSGSAYIFRRDGESWTQQQKLTASDGVNGDQFGFSVSISGDYAIIGAYLDDDKGSESGSAYIFHRNGEDWTQQAKLTASDGNNMANFGRTVSIDGNYAVIGAWRDFSEDAGGSPGSAYIFHFDGENWTQQAKLAPNDRRAGMRFGWSVSIDGDYTVVGADGDGQGVSTYEAGSAYIFHRNGESWTQQAKLIASDRTRLDNFGSAVSIDGDYAGIGATHDDDKGYSSGSAYIFYRNGENWTQQTKLKASDGWTEDCFGNSVSISGANVLIGSSGDDDNGDLSGSAYIFHRDDDNWTQQTKLTASDGAADDLFGSSVSIDGDYAIIDAHRDYDEYLYSGSAYVFYFEEDNGEPDIAVEPQELDFGEVEIPSSAQLSFDITNNGDGDLTVSDIMVDEECFGTDFAGEFVLAPEASQTVVVTFEPSAEGEYSGQVTICSDDPDSPEVYVDLNGVGIPGESPEALTEKLIDEIEGMVNAGELNNNQARFLLTDLERALVLMQQGRVLGAISFLNDLKRRVATLVWWGILSPEEGNAMIAAANEILDALGADGDATLEGLIAAVEKELPDMFSLSATYPNPFNSTTTISFTLPFEMQTSLTVYDVTGRQVETLVDGVQQMGVHNAAFNADRFTTGMYFVVLNAGGKVLTQKVMLVR